jgi:hypothetical protein
MQTAELLKDLSGPLKKMQVQELATLTGAGRLPVHDLLLLSFLKEHPSVAFRSSWVLEEVTHRYPDRFAPYLPEFVERLPEQQNLSCQRHFTKILMFCTAPKADLRYSAAWQAIPDRAPVVETVFDWLIHPHTPVAVQVNCLDVLLYLQAEFPWVKDELKAQVEYLLKEGSPAMRSRGKKILQRISKGKS